MPVSPKRKNRGTRPRMSPVTVIRHRKATDPAGHWHYDIVRTTTARRHVAQLAADGEAEALPPGLLGEAEAVAAATWTNPDERLEVGVAADGRWIKWHVKRAGQPPVPPATDRTEDQ